MSRKSARTSSISREIDALFDRAEKEEREERNKRALEVSQAVTLETQHVLQESFNKSGKLFDEWLPPSNAQHQQLILELKDKASSIVERHAAWERAEQEQREIERQQLFATYIEHKAYLEENVGHDPKESSSNFTVSLLEESGNIMVGSP